MDAKSEIFDFRGLMEYQILDGMDGHGVDGRGMDGHGVDARGADFRGAYYV